MMDYKKIRDLFEITDGGGGGSGFSEEEIVRCEVRLGKRLPEVLRRYYLELGKNEQINQTQDSLVLPPELEVHEDGFVTFYYENQAVWRAGIKFSDFDLDDPNVHLSYSGEGWEYEIGELSNFLTAEALFQAVFALPYNANKIEVDGERENYIRRNWAQSGVRSHVWETDFFQNSPGEILALMKNGNQTDVYVATGTRERFTEIDKELGIDWDNSSLERE